jgi:hypothetical protein
MQQGVGVEEIVELAAANKHFKEHAPAGTAGQCLQIGTSL